MPEAELWRVRLPWSCAPELVLAALEHEHFLCCLTGVWAGGGTIIASEPLRVAEPQDDPFTLFDDLPDVPRTWRRPQVPSVAAGSAGSATAWPRTWSRSRSQRHVLCRCPTSTSPTTTTFCTEMPTGSGGSRRSRPRTAAPSWRSGSNICGGAWPTSASRKQSGAGRPAPLRLTPEVAAHHLAAVAECRERIAAGEIFQANICLRLESEYDGPPTALVRGALVHGRVPQYTAVFNTPTGGIVSLSPELFLRRKGRQVRSGPIKGTAHRPNDPGRAILSLEQLQARPRTLPST